MTPIVPLAIYLVLGMSTVSNVSAEPLPEMMQPLDLSDPEATVRSMMRAMYQGDADMVDSVFIDGAELRRVTYDGDLRPDGFQRWRDWVATLEVGDAYEDVFGIETQTFGKLASVWAPFVIDYKGERVGCGVNQLTLAHTGTEWRVLFAVDTHRPRESCANFKSDYLAGVSAQ